MGKKRGGMCQTNPATAKKMIEYFGSFLAFLIRVYPYETGRVQGSKEHTGIRVLNLNITAI